VKENFATLNRHIERNDAFDVRITVQASLFSRDARQLHSRAPSFLAPHDRARMARLLVRRVLKMKRREFLKLSLGSAALAALSQRVQADSSVKEIRIGYQKNGVLVIARQRTTLEKYFKPFGVEVKWVEFSSGPPMMEAMNVGSIDFGAVGDSPPVFAQAAGAAIVYAAGEPITNGQGILVPQHSAIRSIAELKGKRIGFTKGSSAHNIVVQTLEKAGLTYNDIIPVYLTPPDAGPAFANGSIEAWAIWDPYLAIGESKQNGRVLVNANEITKTNSFYIANRDFAKNHGSILQQIIDVTTSTAAWAEGHRDEVAKSLSAVTGIPLEIQTIAANRSAFIGQMTDDIIATQQGVADRFFKLGLIPREIAIRDISGETPRPESIQRGFLPKPSKFLPSHGGPDRD
jgi:sulfonate transport system substrate-binding protein